MKVSLKREGEKIRVRFQYSPILLERIRMIPGRRFDAADKSWTVPAVRDAILMASDMAGVMPEMLDGDLRSLLGESTEEEEIVDLSSVQDRVFLTEPYEHQRKNLARLVAHNRWLLADECGTGKSHAVCNRLLSIVDREVAAVLILCPKSVCAGWKKQLQEHAGLPAIVVEGERKRRVQQLDVPFPAIKIANYEALLHTDFKRVLWTHIVLDEIHRVKNFTAATSKRVRNLTAEAECVWALSGTPAPNGMQDWLGVLAAIDPEGAPWKTKGAFEAAHVVKSRLGGSGPFVVSGYRNVSDLRRVIKRYVSRVTKAEALDLPEKVYETRSVSLEGEQARIYKEMRKDAVARLEAKEEEGTLTASNVLTESLRLLQICGGFVPDDSGKMHAIADNGKEKMLHEVLEEVGDKQVVFWCAFVAEAHWLKAWLEKEFSRSTLLCRCSLLVGGTNAEERQFAISDFVQGKSRFFVGTASAGGTGVNGLEVANTCIFYSRNFSLTDYLQAQDRLHRIGSKSKVTILKLVAEGTIEEKIEQALERKASLQDMLLGQKISDFFAGGS